jgi:integrating conjugative element protein (TIGR03746 family)
MSKPIEALQVFKDQNRRLYRANWGLLALCALVGWYGHHKAANLNIHTSANPRAGEVIEVRNGLSPVPASTTYGFAFYVWQQLNRWPANGSVDYGQQIFAMQNYVTPRCQEWLKSNMASKQRDGELAGRQRSLQEMIGRGFTHNRVIPSGESWTVLMDMQLVETLKGQVVKDVFLRYSLPVVRYQVDLKLNPWQLGIDCNNSTNAQRLEAPAAAASGPAPGELNRAAAQLGAPPPLPLASGSTGATP